MHASLRLTRRLMFEFFSISFCKYCYWLVPSLHGLCCDLGMRSFHCFLPRAQPGILFWPNRTNCPEGVEEKLIENKFKAGKGFQKHKTVARRLATLSWIHNKMGFTENDPVQDPAVAEAMRRVKSDVQHFFLIPGNSFSWLCLLKCLYTPI